MTTTSAGDLPRSTPPSGAGRGSALPPTDPVVIRRLTLMLVDERGARSAPGIVTVCNTGAARDSLVAALSGDDTLVLGRDATCQLRLGDRRVSRWHCEIFRVGDVAWVRDRDSLNGTLLDGELVEVAPLPLRAVVQLGLGGPKVEILSSRAEREPEKGRPEPSAGRSVRGCWLSRLQSRLRPLVRCPRPALMSFVLGAALAHSGVTAQSIAAEADFTLGTAFTYQGRLQQQGKPAEGSFDFSFALYDSAERGTFLGRIDRFEHPVRGGVFTTEMDFGRDSFSDVAWLEIEVRPAGAGQYTTLSPRQRLAANVASTCTVNSDVQINGDLSLALGRELRVGNAITGLNLDQNEIWATALGGPQLLINGRGSGNLGVRRSNAAAPLHVTGSPDVSPSGGGPVVIGELDGHNLAIDNNEIMARNNGAASTLHLNAEGGAVSIGGPLKIGYEIAVSSAQCSGGWKTASCSPGKRVVGGGCRAIGTVVETFFPSGGNHSTAGGNTAFTCFFDTCSGNDTAYAMCVNVQ